MKNWENAELVEVSIHETAYGGKPSLNFDNSWFDENKAEHVTFS